jgi:hypothetical protein
MRRLLLALLLSPAPALAAAPAVIEQGMTISGDREAPQLLYIVPWQAPPPVALPPLPEPEPLPPPPPELQPE